MVLCLGMQLFIGNAIMRNELLDKELAHTFIVVLSTNISVLVLPYMYFSTKCIYAQTLN